MKIEENQPLITTIIPTYKRPKLLQRAILSVLNQTYPNFQVCIYDNASNDETADVVKKLNQQDSRVHYYCHSKNISMQKNFNFGLRMVKTPYFSFLCDDDILLPKFYEKALNGFSKYPEAGFVATETIVATEKEIKEVSLREYEEKLYKPLESLIKMSKCKIPYWTSILFRKEVIKKVGFLDENLGASADTDFLFSSASIFSFVVLKSPGAIFFVHQLSKSSSWSEIEPLDGYIKTLEKIKNNRKISAPIRLMVYQNRKKRIERVLWQGGLKDIKKRNFFQAKRLAKSLKEDFGRNFKGVILYNIANLCENLDICYFIFFYLNQIRKFLKPNRNNLQKNYEAYLKYFQKYSSL